MPRLVCFNGRWNRGSPIYDWHLWLDDDRIFRVYNRGIRAGRWCEVDPPRTQRRVFVSPTGYQTDYEITHPEERPMDAKLIATQWRAARKRSG
jgi:hypothetical protein